MIARFGVCALWFMLWAAQAGAESQEEALGWVAFVRVGGSDLEGTVQNRTGSGFLVGDDGWLITAYHIVAPPSSGWGTDQLGLKDVRMAVVIRDHDTGLLSDVREATVASEDPDHDVALLRFQGAARRGLRTCPPTTPALGDELVVVGVEPGKGSQTATLEIRGGRLTEARSGDAPFSRVSAATEEGFSGGPVFAVQSDGSWRVAGVLKGGAPLNVRVDSLFTPLSTVRQRILAACDEPCRHPDHDIERYMESETGALHVSGWQRGGSNPTKYCDAYAAEERRKRPGDVISVIHSDDNDDRFFTGRRGNQYIIREAQYKYECQLQYDRGPIYNRRISASCPAPPNPLGLPR